MALFTRTSVVAAILIGLKHTGALAESFIEAVDGQIRLQGTDVSHHLVSPNQ
jgi:hypothetical protein